MLLCPSSECENERRREGKCVASFSECGMCSASYKALASAVKKTLYCFVYGPVSRCWKALAEQEGKICCAILRLCYVHTECQNAARSVCSRTDSLSETDAPFRKLSASLNGWHHIWLVQNAGFCVAHIEVIYLKCMEVHRGHKVLTLSYY